MIKQISITATIAAGGTTASTTSDTTIHGRILKVDVNYPTNVVEVDLDTVGEQKAQKIMDLASANTDVTYYPRTPVSTYTGAETVVWYTALKAYEPFLVFGKITLSLAAGTAGDSVKVGITYED